MKKTLLIGLAAVALGSMTACSNILEEEGVISAKTGILSVGLDTDASVNIVTKADPYNVPTNLYNLDNFNVVVSNGEDQVSDLTGFFKDIKNNKSVVATGTYTLTAMNKDEDDVQPFEWNAPFFKGTDSEQLEANSNIILTTECTLANSIIDIDLDNLLVTEDDIEVISLTAKSSTEESCKIYENNAVVGGKVLGIDMLYAKADIGAKLELVIKSKTINTPKTITTLIKDTNEDTNVAKKKYNVTYSFVENGQGVVAISVSVNGSVDIVTLNESVNPYANN